MKTLDRLGDRARRQGHRELEGPQVHRDRDAGNIASDRQGLAQQGRLFAEARPYHRDGAAVLAYLIGMALRNLA